MLDPGNKDELIIVAESFIKKDKQESELTRKKNARRTQKPSMVHVFSIVKLRQTRTNQRGETK